MNKMFQWVWVGFVAAFTILVAALGITFKIAQYALFGKRWNRLGAWCAIISAVALYWIIKQPAFIHPGVPVAAFGFFGGLGLFIYKNKNHLP